MTKTKKSRATLSFRPQYRDLNPLDIMHYHFSGLMSRNMSQWGSTRYRPLPIAIGKDFIFSAIFPGNISIKYRLFWGPGGLWGPRWHQDEKKRRKPWFVGPLPGPKLEPSWGQVELKIQTEVACIFESNFEASRIRCWLHFGKAFGVQNRSRNRV